MSSAPLSDIEQALAFCLKDYQDRAATVWQGSEKEALFALTRALDFSAVCAYLNANLDASSPDSASGLNQAIFLMGCAPAFRPFLGVVKNLGGGVPFAPTHPDVARFAKSYIDACGKLTFIRRMALLERYGLATTEKVEDTDFRIKVSPSAPEQAVRYSMHALWQSSSFPETSARKRKRWNRVHGKMKRFVDLVDGWFIQYNSDEEIVAAYREKARHFGRGYLEAEAFPDDVIIGGRTFGEWKEACNWALGRVLAHIDFAAFLHKKRPFVALKDILTIWVRRDDMEAIWIEAGLPPAQVKSTMRALTLGVDELDEWEHSFEVPTAFYIDYGSGFLLLPCFGALMNPYFALFRHLREVYKADWDRAVDRREAIFRADLISIFPRARFTIPKHGFKLRRPNSSLITDIDAVILDNDSGDLALVQLKWHDIFGFSLSERESRRKNIVKANEWVDKVASWVEGRSSRELLQALGLKGEASNRPPLLYVVARYSARFSGDHVHDARATWLAWPEFQLALKEIGEQAPLSAIPAWITAYEKRFEQSDIRSFEFQFPKLRVSLELPIQ